MDEDDGLDRAMNVAGRKPDLRARGSLFTRRCAVGFSVGSGEPDRFVVLNAAAPIEEIAAKIRTSISQRFAIGE